MSNEGGLELQISPSAGKYVFVPGWNVKQDTTNRNNLNNRDSCILCLVNPSLTSPRTSYCVDLHILADWSKSVPDRQGFGESLIRQPIVHDNTTNMAAQGRLQINPHLSFFWLSSRRHKIVLLHFCPANLPSLDFETIWNCLWLLMFLGSWRYKTLTTWSPFVHTLFCTASAHRQKIYVFI